MLTLDNSNCLFIIANSEEIDKVIANPTDFSTINTSIKKNCCGTVYTDLFDITNVANIGWIFQYNFLASASIESIKILNIATGKVFEAISSPGLISNPVDSATEIDSILTPFFATLGLSFSGSTTTHISGNTYRVNLGGTTVDFPSGFAPISISLIMDGVPSTYTWSWYSSSTNSNITLTAEGLIIGSLLYNSSSKYTDGIYTISIRTANSSGSGTNEQSCIFLDCNTACNLASILSKLDSSQTTNMLMLHYALTEGANCSCNNCDYLCSVYSTLTKSINAYLTDATQGNDCGCS